MTSDDLDLHLLRALALGGKHSHEIEAELSPALGDCGDFKTLALRMTGLSVTRESAHATFEYLVTHREEMRKAIGRKVGIKTAAMDCLDRLDPKGTDRDDDLGLSYDQLIRMVFRDHLTGLENFRSFSRRFQQEIARADRYRHLCSLIMVDVDHFKKFNDTHGHEAGNFALRVLAEVLRNHTRETDVAARYGGEEFAILLPETTKNDAALIAEEFRRAVERIPVTLEGIQTSFTTVSLGLATYPCDSRKSAELLERADSALYTAKRGGRNQLSIYYPDTSVRLFYAPEHLQAAQCVHVVGDFNGWNRSQDELLREQGGGFVICLPVVPGRYAYKFIINRERYIPDPHATEFELDGFGGRNSVVHVK